MAFVILFAVHLSSFFKGSSNRFAFYFLVRRLPINHRSELAFYKRWPLRGKKFNGFWKKTMSCTFNNDSSSFFCIVFVPNPTMVREWEIRSAVQQILFIYCHSERYWGSEGGSQRVVVVREWEDDGTAFQTVSHLTLSIWLTFLLLRISFSWNSSIIQYCTVC